MNKAEFLRAVGCRKAPGIIDQYLNRLETHDSGNGLLTVDPDKARLLFTIFNASNILSEYILTHPDLLKGDLFNPACLQNARQAQGLHREVNEWLLPLLQSADYPKALSLLRQFKQREMLRIALRDLLKFGTTEEIILELSNAADVCLDAVYRICHQQLIARYGQPYHQTPSNEWMPTTFCVIGLGKLGGQELNYSSDVDVIFIYAEEGHVYKTNPGKTSAAPKGITNHSFFSRLAESYIAEISRLTPDGQLHRIDLRLRPEGGSGPLVRSLSSYENYYAQWGQTWERMMLIKARPITGDLQLGGEFLEIIQTFRYPRAIGEQAPREVAQMKKRIEKEVVKIDNLKWNVKLGYGGIREIEFVVQTLQMIHAGKLPFLQGSKTLPLLNKMVQYQLLTQSEAQTLAKGYTFLRDIEHRLQVEDQFQTHTIPQSATKRERLAHLMSFPDWKTFEATYEANANAIRAIFSKTVGYDAEEEKLSYNESFDDAAEAWKKTLSQHGFRDPDKCLPLLKAFVQGPGYIHVSSRTEELGRRLLPLLLNACPSAQAENPQPLEETEPGEKKKTRVILSDPDRVLVRLDQYVNAYHARQVIYETWLANPSLFNLVLLAIDRSEHLAELIIKTPDMLDVLVQSGQLRRNKDAQEMHKDLSHGIHDADQSMWLRRYHQTELTRIALREILELASPLQNTAEITSLADACLRYAMDVVMKKHGLKKPPFTIIAMGKLGGRELTYGSDLDVLFVASAKTKNSAKLQGMAVGIIDLLSNTTEHGAAFSVDARLRPDGAKGLLVNTIDAYLEYYQRRAMLWEIQTLTRARAVAGNMILGQSFEQMAAELTNFSQPKSNLVSYTEKWPEEIARMRARIEKERTPANKNLLAFKTGMGGLIDAEFVAQAVCMQKGWQEPNTLQALIRMKKAGIFPAEQSEQLIQAYLEICRMEMILRRWSFAGESVLPDDAPAQLRVAMRCGFSTAQEFLNTLAQWRTTIRTAFNQYFGLK